MTCLCLFSPHYIFCPLSTLSPNFSPLSNSFLPFLFPNATSSPLTATFPLSVFSLISPSLISSLFSLSPSFPFPFFFQTSNLPYFSFPFSLSSLLHIFHISRLPPSLSLSLSNFQNSYSFSLPRFSSSFPLTSFLSLLLPFCNNPLLSFSCLPTYLSTSFSLTHSLN